jgi:glycosyltransferase involved in cell wall biosynthesis
LYLHPTGSFGGASKSLIELFAALKHYSVEGYVITPKGSAVDAFVQAGLKTIETLGLSQFDNTRYSYYRNFRWLILLRELFFLPFSLLALWRVKKLGVSFDLIHVNEITLLPIGVLAKLFFRIPVVFHIRSLQRNEANSLRSKLVFRLVKKYSDVVICIDETVKASIPAWLKSTAVHNGINMDSATPQDENQTMPRKLTIGMAGVLLRSKGVYEFVEAAKILLVEKKYDLEFVLAGENARVVKGLRGWIYKKLGFSEDVVSEIKKYVQENGLDHQIIIKGFIKDVRSFYPSLDILCFPSHLNACGRPVFEAAFYGIPSVVAIANPLEDAIIHETTGLAIEKPDPELIANAIERLVVNAEFRLGLGKHARDWAEKNFLIESNAEIVWRIYNQIIKAK